MFMLFWLFLITRGPSNDATFATENSPALPSTGSLFIRSPQQSSWTFSLKFHCGFPSFCHLCHSLRSVLTVDPWTTSSSSKEDGSIFHCHTDSFSVNMTSCPGRGDEGLDKHSTQKSRQTVGNFSKASWIKWSVHLDVRSILSCDASVAGKTCRFISVLEGSAEHFLSTICHLV